MKVTHALMAELVDATDLKSVIRKGVRVRVPLGAPSFLRGYDMSSFYKSTQYMTLDMSLSSLFAFVAQLVEHRFCKPAVRSSTLLEGSILNMRLTSKREWLPNTASGRGRHDSLVKSRRHPFICAQAI